MGRDETTGLVKMKQVGLIDRVIEALGLGDGMAKVKLTPADFTLLVKDTDGEEACGSFI